MHQISIISKHFWFWTYLGLTGGKYLIKIIFDIKIEICIFEISIRPNLNKFWTFSIFLTNLGLTGGKYFIKIVFVIKIKICILEILDVPSFDKL